MPLLIKQTDRKGVLEAHRNENEPPFARILSPSFRKTRTWAVCYRDAKAASPFDETCPNVSQPNFEAVEYELQRVVKFGTDYQLGLTDEMTTRHLCPPYFVEAVKSFRSEAEAESYVDAMFPNCAACYEGKTIAKASIENVGQDWIVEIMTYTTN